MMWRLPTISFVLALVTLSCSTEQQQSAQPSTASAPKAAAPALDNQAAVSAAVLLPHSGAFAASAQAIRSGLTAGQNAGQNAGQHASGGNQRMTLDFFDSSNPADIAEIVQRAVSGGADLIIGPLQPRP